MRMNPINLKHLLIAKENLDDSLCLGLTSLWGVSPKDCEYCVLADLFNQIARIDSPYQDHLFDLFEGCYFGFKIPRISKEFDCLWIGKDAIVNLELKSGDKPEVEIEKQLLRNRYYLRPLKRTICSYTYVAATHTCYMIDQSEKIVKVELVQLAKCLTDIHKQELLCDNLESYFPPEVYLVSPFNSTESFLEHEYFLTGQQEEIKKKVITAVKDPAGPKFMAINGEPGSGKTLLLYDIAYALMEDGVKVVIGHGGGLNKGQLFLRSKGWDIRRTMNLYKLGHDSTASETTIIPATEAEVYLMDESQRSSDLQFVIDDVKNNGKRCIFSYDSEQCLNGLEIKQNNGAEIFSLTSPDWLFRLTSSIRSNESVYEFIKALFDAKKTVRNSVKGCVEVSYCENVQQVRKTQKLLNKRGYVTPCFTPNASYKQPRNDYEDWFIMDLSAHNIIGQEFDKVVGLISPNMYYDKDGKLVSKKPYFYIEDRMLYQILTRARKKIHLIVFNNKPMLQRCIELLSND